MFLSLRNRFFAPSAQPDAAAQSARRIEVAQVAHYMAAKASTLRSARDATEQFDNPALSGEARMLQAGAAGAQAMADLLLATVVGDKAEFRRVFNAFVDDAHAAGVLS